MAESMDNTNQILNEIKNLLINLNFKEVLISGRTNYVYKNTYCIPHYIETLGFLIEYASSMEEAKKNFHEDGEVFPLSMGKNAILDGLEKELQRDVLSK
jgi:hypothetical protein